jgi:hypothetical protein
LKFFQQIFIDQNNNFRGLYSIFRHMYLQVPLPDRQALALVLAKPNFCNIPWSKFMLSTPVIRMSDPVFL